MGYFGSYILNNSHADIINGIKDDFGEGFIVLDYSFDKQSYCDSYGNKVNAVYLAVETKADDKNALEWREKCLNR